MTDIVERPIEVELKYRVVDLAAAERYLVADEIGMFSGGAVVRSTQMEDRYVDTDDGALALAYVQTVKVEGRSLSIAYDWLAETDVHVHMWRHQIDFPVTAYGGGSFDAGAGEAPLPVERAPQPSLASGLRRITLRPATGPTVTVEIDGEAGLVDERHYGVSAYRLGHYPVHGNLKAGQTWKVGLRITVD